MTPTTDTAEALTLVQQGWGQLQHQRPLAAWSSWQRALRIAQDDPAARQALETLESAPELPAAARAVYRFQAPSDPGRRARWDRRFRERDLEQLDEAAAAFAALAAEDPADAAAAYNEGLCLAWLGRNVEAIEALDRAVRLLAADDFDRAVEAWTLAEVLRQGGGAEALADDLRFAWIIEVADPDALDRLAGRVPLLSVPPPRDPVSERSAVAAEIFEWLDRPLPEGAEGLRSAADVPRLMATLVRTPHAWRLSSPDPQSLDEIHGTILQVLGDVEGSIRREAIPLPLPLLDAAVWTLRLPPGLDVEIQRELTRGTLESFYEDRWIHVPRKGLDGRTPLEASRLAREDPVVRARLAAVVRFREQLGERHRTAQLYQGYPFDRLRRRLGLELANPDAVDPLDFGCMSEAELDRFDPAALDDTRLADAFESAAGLREDRRTVRFAAELARRNPPSLPRLALAALFAPLVREAMSAPNPRQAIAWLDRACEIGPDQGRRTFDIWRAEVHARSGYPDFALKTYEALLEHAPSDIDLALDAAETLLDNGYEDHALLLLMARDQTLREADEWTRERARRIRDRIMS